MSTQHHPDIGDRKATRSSRSCILDTFPIVRRKDHAAQGTYRTKDTILALYDQLAEAQRNGVAFVSALAPPPGDARCCHPARETL
jgi:hypothetical protein